MKKSEAADRLAEFLADLLNKHPLDSEGGFKIFPILDFLESEIGMLPPSVFKEVSTLQVKSVDTENKNVNFQRGSAFGYVSEWEPEESDREREFQSKKDSCI